MKKSEARILIFLNNANDRFKYAKFMAFKLNMDYGYLINILSDMKMKKWVNCVKRDNKKFYYINKGNILDIASIRLGKK